MSVLPSKNTDFLAFCEAHWPVWQTNFAAIGVTSAQAAAFKTSTQSARTVFDAANAARQASRAATTTMNGQFTQTRAMAADLIRVIKSFAEQQTNPNAVYGLAQIPPPAAPTPAPAPGQPTNVTVGLEPSGAITLRWKSVNAAPAAGTYFSIKRKDAGGSVFFLVGNTGAKTFTDNTITQGTASATYIVQGHRGTLDGPESEQIGVQFGVGDGGGFAVTNATIAGGTGSLRVAA